MTLHAILVLVRLSKFAILHCTVDQSPGVSILRLKQQGLETILAVNVNKYLKSYWFEKKIAVASLHQVKQQVKQVFFFYYVYG